MLFGLRRRHATGAHQVDLICAEPGIDHRLAPPMRPQANGMVERFIRSLKEECVWQHRFESISHAREVIGQWIRHYNTERPHQALGYRVPAQLAA